MATSTARKPALNKKHQIYIILGTSPESGEKFIVPPEDEITPYIATSVKSVEKAVYDRRIIYPKYTYGMMQLHELLRSYEVKITNIK